MTTFDALGVGAPVLRALETLGFEKPTEIQAAAIPVLMEGQDLIGVAQTGGGKTAAFVLPMIERLSGRAEKPKAGMPRALILAPTRELAIQITDKIKELTVGTALRCCTVYGGAPYKTQIHILRRGVDVLIATPGRLRDHMKQGNIYLDETEYFVLDEADRMLDMGFVDEVRTIARKLPAGHQSVMFSATLNAKISDLAETLLQDAVRVEVARQATIADNLDHKVLFVPGHKKNDLLLDLIEREQPGKALVFVRTRRNADQMCEFLEAVGFKANSIHGDKKQNVRQRTINNFKAGKFDYLVATDVAARGIDVDDITHVFNMDVPVEAESYVHRIGRTARGGASGKAFTLCGKSEMRLLRDIEALIKMAIEVDHDHAYPMPAGPAKGGKGRSEGRGGDRRNGERRGGRADGRRSDKRSSESRRGDGPRTRGDRPQGKGGKSANIKPWEKRAKKRARNEAETKATQWDPAEHSYAAPEAAETAKEKPASKPKAKRAAPAVKQADAKPATKKAKRVDPGANKRKSKAGAKAAKKRPAVAARKAKTLKAKNFRKPSGSSANTGTVKGGKTSGGNAPLRRKG